MGPRARSAPTFLLLLLAGCASSSAHLPRVVTIEAGRRVRVTLSDAQGRMFAMQNLSSGSRNEVYRDPGSTAQPKVVRDPDLQTLLDALADRGMFARATPEAPAEARAVIAVETPDRSWFWARPAVDPLRDASQQPGLREFDEARGYVLAVYNSEMSFHAGTIDSFAPEVRKQIDDARKAPGAPATRNDK
jgi:hypothetical protein